MLVRFKPLDLLIIFPWFVMAVSCSIEPPGILQVRYDHHFETQPERLSFFLHVENSEDFEFLEAIFLIHDEKELFWKISRNEWISDTLNGELWIGTTGIRMPVDTQFPPGLYRILLVDRSGERAEKEIFLRHQAEPDTAFKAIFD